MKDLIEIKNKRKRREKHFLKPDGTLLAILYDDNMHYLDHGTYLEIDPTLEETEDYYTNTKNEFHTSFCKQVQDYFMKMEVFKKKLRFSLEEMNPVSALLEENRVIYRNLLDHIDVMYELSNSQVKESILLHERRTEPFLFHIDTDYTLELQENNQIKVLDQGKLIFAFESPYMMDEKQRRSDNCFYELQQTPKGYLLKLYVDQEFLNDPETVYPVVIDPTITNKMQSNNVYDTYIFDEDMNVNCNNQDILKVGFDNYDNLNKVFRTLLKFELPTIGTGYEVIDAYVNLVSHPASMVGTLKETPIIDVHAMNRNWNEATAKWASFSNKYDPKIDSTFQFVESDLQGLDIILRNNQFDITNLVKKWYSGTPNYGMLLKSHNESNRSSVKVASFCSKNYTGTETTPKPLLVLTYQNQNGLENYFSYQQQVLTAGTTYVNTYNGNLTGVFELGSTIGGPNPVHLALVYNTNDVVLNHDVGYGVGYQLSHYQTIKEVKIEEENLLEYLDGDGTIHYFYKDPEKENTYIDEDGLSFTIIKQDTQYKMQDKEQNEFLFTKNGDRWYLTKMINTEGDQTTIVYNDQKKIETVTDSLGETVSLDYQDHQTIITSPSDTITLTYENGCLVSLTNKEGVTTFAYNEHHVLTKITDPNLKGVTYEYYASPYKMKKITELGLNDAIGNSLTFTYSFETTSVMDHKGRVNTYTFNHRGNNVGVTSLKTHEELRSAFAGTNLYGDYTGSINKLTAKNATVQYVKNYLPNSSFEEEGIIFTHPKTRATPTNDYEPRSGKKNLIFWGDMGNQEVEQVVSVPKGSYYTFSAYIKSDSMVELILSYQDASLETQMVRKQIKPEGAHDYIRSEVTIYYPVDATSDLTISMACNPMQNAHIDDVQLEQGEVASYYNMLENTDFSDGMNHWTLRSTRRNSDMDVVDIAPQGSIVTSSNGTKMLKINGAPDIETTLQKEFSVNGKKGDAFHLSFWYKNLGINSPFHSPSRNALIAFYPADEDMGQGAIFSVDLNRSEEWQFFSRNYVAEYDYSKIRLTIFDLQNANELYVTNFSLFKDLENNSYVYDEDGNLTLSTQLNKEKNEFQYDKNNQLVQMMDPKGANFHFEYDNNIGNRLLKAIAPNGVTNEFVYDFFGNPMITRVRNMNPKQELLEESYYIRAKGTDQYLKSDLFHKSLSFKTDTCSHDSFTLLKVGEDYRIKYSTNSSYFVTAYNQTLILTKNEDDTSLFTIIKNKNGSYSLKAKTSALYLTLKDDQLTLQEKIEENHGQQFYFETKESDLFIENHAEYTPDGRFITKMTDSLGHSTTYDVNTENGLINGVVDAKENRIDYTYNDKEQITKIKNKDQEVHYQYNSQDLLSNILHGTKNYQFIYDDFLNPKQIKMNDQPLITHEYEEQNGNLISSTYANGQKIEFTYDDFDRIKNVIKKNDIYHYKYDNLGNLAKVLSNHGDYHYLYDFAQRLNMYSYNRFKIRYNYDKNNQVVETVYFEDGIQYPVNYTYNNQGTLTKISYHNGDLNHPKEEINYLYDDLERIKEVNINDQYKTSYTYVTNGKQTSNLVETFKTGEDVYKYQYDALNQTTHIYKNNELIHRYEYNEYQELITDEDYIQQKTIRYIYDLYGNIKTRKEYELFTSNLLHEDTYSYHNPKWQDQLTKFNDQTITYDALGNPMTIGDDITLTWMNGRELETYQTPDQTIQYTYDKDGIRTSKTVNNVKTMYYTENNHIIFEITPQAVIYYLQEANGDLVGLRYNNTTYYYLKNDSEDIIGILDHNYNKLASYEYDAYGNILSIKDQYGNDIRDNDTHIANVNPFRYRSYYYDRETNLYYLNSRYYNPVWGRFINVDGIIGANKDITSHNLYTYTSNNPINLVDLSGKFAIAAGAGLSAAVAAGLVIGAAAASYTVSATIGYFLSAWQEIQMKIQAAVQEATKTLDEAKKKMKKKSKDTRMHTVYTLKDNGGTVLYVGRTVNYKARMSAHQGPKSPRKGLEEGEKKENLTYAQARGLEQSWIRKYKTLNRGNPAANQINGIRWDNPECHKFMNAAQIFLPESETYVGYCK